MAHESATRRTSVTEYRSQRWPMRVLLAFWVGIAAFVATTDVGAGLGVLVVFIVCGIPLLVLSERAGVFVTPAGLRNVPLFGRSRTYPWDRVAGFTVRPLHEMRFDGFVVIASRPGRSVPLMATARRRRQRDAVQRMCDELNADLDRAGHRRWHPDPGLGEAEAS